MSDDLTLWQQTLAAEHAAIWGFGLVGATAPLAVPASAALDLHRGRRTRCADMVVALGGEPVASAPAYDIARPSTPRAARELAADLEEGCSVAYAALTGAGQRRSRLQGAAWLRQTTVAIWRWSGDVPALPGLEDASPDASTDASTEASQQPSPAD